MINWQRVVFWIGAGLLLALVAWLLTPAHAHLRGASDAEIQWMMSLQNGNNTICCDFDEAKDIDDANWDTAIVDGKPHYRVRFDGEWLVVDDNSVVVPTINRHGAALAWIAHLNGKPWVKCFLPGAGT